MTLEWFLCMPIGLDHTNRLVPLTRLELVRCLHRGIFGAECRCCPYSISTGIQQVPCVYLFHHSGMWLRWVGFAPTISSLWDWRLNYLTTPQYWAVITSCPGRRLVGRIILRGEIRTYNHRQSPPLDYLTHFRMSFKCLYWAIGLSPIGTMVGFVCAWLTNGLLLIIRSIIFFFNLTDQVLICYIVFSYIIFLRYFLLAVDCWTRTNDKAALGPLYRLS